MASTKPRVVTPSVFEARTTAENVPPAVGVPLKRPAEERLKPGGRLPDWTA
jgi:hypothetical protein